MLEKVARPNRPSRRNRGQTMQVHEITDLNYERAIRDYQRTRDDLLLHEDLAALGFDNAEIEWHAEHSGQRMRQGFVNL